MLFRSQAGGSGTEVSAGFVGALAYAQGWEEEFGDAVGFLQMGVAGGYYGLDAECLVFAKAGCDGFGAADQGGAYAVADQADAGP